MAVQDWQELIRRADALTADEQLRLAAYLVDRARQAYAARGSGNKWRDLCGIAPHPLTGEDAQAWVSRTRQEADKQREFPRGDGE